MDVGHAPECRWSSGVSTFMYTVELMLYCIYILSGNTNVFRLIILARETLSASINELDVVSLIL